MGYGLGLWVGVMGWGLWVNVGANGNLPLYKKIYNKNEKFHFALYTIKFIIKTQIFILPLYKKICNKNEIFILPYTRKHIIKGTYKPIP
jgi:hypothetical protein